MVFTEFPLSDFTTAWVHDIDTAYSELTLEIQVYECRTLESVSISFAHLKVCEWIFLLGSVRMYISSFGSVRMDICTF